MKSPDNDSKNKNNLATGNTEIIMIVQCTACGTKYKIPPERTPAQKTRFRCTHCKHVFAVDPYRTKILVAKDNKEFCLSVKEILEDHDFEVLTASDGCEAMKMIQEGQPALALLDVALPKIYGFELCETLKSDPLTRHLRIILLAASYRKARYKRLPESLYGADDYIEIHHIEDKLIEKIRLLLSDSTRTAGERPEEKKQTEADTQAARASVPEELLGKVERLARTMLSDIALYNEKKIKEGLLEGDLEERLAPELEEAEEMINQRFPEVPVETLRYYLQRQIAIFVHKTRTTLGV
jgi:predicted Zn finger-like uncharacterized protein